MKRSVLRMSAIVKKSVGRFMSLANLGEIYHMRAFVVLTEMNAQSALSFV